MFFVNQEERRIREETDAKKKADEEAKKKSALSSMGSTYSSHLQRVSANANTYRGRSLWSLFIEWLLTCVCVNVSALDRLTRREEERRRLRERRRRRSWPPGARHSTSTIWTKTSWGTTLPWLQTSRFLSIHSFSGQAQLHVATYSYSSTVAVLGYFCVLCTVLNIRVLLNYFTFSFPAGKRSMSCISGWVSWSLRSSTTWRDWRGRSTRWDFTSQCLSEWRRRRSLYSIFYKPRGLGKHCGFHVMIFRSLHEKL